MHWSVAANQSVWQKTVFLTAPCSQSVDMRCPDRADYRGSSVGCGHPTYWWYHQASWVDCIRWHPAAGALSSVSQNLSKSLWRWPPRWFDSLFDPVSAVLTYLQFQKRVFKSKFLLISNNLTRQQHFAHNLFTTVYWLFILAHCHKKMGYLKGKYELSCLFCRSLNSVMDWSVKT